MAIYNIFKTESAQKEERLGEEEVCAASEEPPVRQKSSYFSSIAARLFFFLLLIADILWGCYALCLLLFSLLGTLFRAPLFTELRHNALLTLRRSLVCGVSLFVALFSPAFGIMIACTYFLMYDRVGIEEVVPSSLQSQFKEFLHK